MKTLKILLDRNEADHYPTKVSAGSRLSRDGRGEWRVGHFEVEDNDLFDW